MKLWTLIIILFVIINITIAETPHRNFKTLPRLEQPSKIKGSAPADEKSLIGLFNLSYQEEKKGNIPKAIEPIKKILTLKADDYSANLRMGWLLYLQKNYKESIIYYKKANKINSTNIDSRYGIYNCLVGLLLYDEAIVNVKKWMTEYPDENSWNLKLGNLYLIKKENSKALIYYETAYKNDPEDSDIKKCLSECYLESAWNEYKKGDFKEAVVQYKKCYDLDKSNKNAIKGLFFSYIKLKDFDNANNFALILEKKELVDGSVYSSLAFLNYNLKKYSLAIKYYEKAVENYPNDKSLIQGLCWSYIYKGLSELKSKNYSEAYDLYNNANIKGKDIEEIKLTSSKGMIDALLGQNKYEKALKLALENENENPNDVEYLTKIGYIYYMLKTYTKSISYYNKVLKLKSKDVNALKGLGWSYIELGAIDIKAKNLVSALENYSNAYKHDPSNQFSIKGIIDVYILQKNWDKALNYSLEYQKNFEKDKQFLKNLAFIYFNLKDYKSSKKYYKLAIEKDENDLDSYLGQGWTLYYLGEYESARKQFEKVLKKDPNNDSAKNGLTLCSKISKTQSDFQIRPLFSYFSYSNNPNLTSGYQAGILARMKLVDSFYIKGSYKHGQYSTKVKNIKKPNEDIFGLGAIIYPNYDLMFSGDFYSVSSNDKLAETGSVIFAQGYYSINDLFRSVGGSFAYSYYPYGNIFQYRLSSNMDFDFFSNFTYLTLYQSEVDNQTISDYQKLIKNRSVYVPKNVLWSIDSYLTFNLSDSFNLTTGGWIGRKIFSVEPVADTIYNTANIVQWGCSIALDWNFNNTLSLTPYCSFYKVENITSEIYSVINTGLVGSIVF